MRAYSTDFRQKVVQAYATGQGSQRQLARLFSVSLSFVQDLLQRYRQTGSVEPKPHGGRNPGKVRPYLAEIERLHTQQPDASLAERCEQLATIAQVRLSRMTMSRALERLHLTRKKRRFGLLSKTRLLGSRREACIGRHSKAKPRSS